MQFRYDIAIFSGICFAGGAIADFDGAYAPKYWTIVEEAGGMVTQDNLSAQLVSGDIGLVGEATLTINAAADGVMSFDWDYWSSDSGGHDDGGYIVDGMYLPLEVNNNPSSGSVSVAVLARQEIGFYVNTKKGLGGPGILTITNFTGPGDAGEECAADCDSNGMLNILDFLCFQGQWLKQTAQGDCDGDGVYNILDFVCFQVAFMAGCP
jgi:hypothetical protein